VKKQRIGATDLSVATLGFGGAPVGNLYTALTDEEAEATIVAALDSGINYFDTAPLYGHGLSEHRIGHVLRYRPRDEFVISTKVGRRLLPADPATLDYGQFPGCLPFRPEFDYSFDGTMRSFEDSLHRLGLHRVDIVLIHDIDRWTHKTSEETEKCFQQAMNGAYPALHRLRSEGVIGAIGAGVNEWQVCQRLATAGDFDCFLLAGRYTLLEHEALESFLPLCELKSIGVIIGGPYNTGILATGAAAGAYYNYESAPEDILQRVRRIERLCAAYDVSLPAAALQFPLFHPAVAAVIPGARNEAEVSENVQWMEAEIPAAFWEEMKREGLVPEHAPTG